MPKKLMGWDKVVRLRLYDKDGTLQGYIEPEEEAPEPRPAIPEPGSGELTPAAAWFLLILIGAILTFFMGYPVVVALAVLAGIAILALAGWWLWRFQAATKRPTAKPELPLGRFSLKSWFLSLSDEAQQSIVITGWGVIAAVAIPTVLYWLIFRNLI